MSTPSNRAREIDDALREITLAAGAQVVFETPRGPHRRAVYTFNGRSRFDVISTSPSSGGVLKAVRRHACTISPGGWFARSARRLGSVPLPRCYS